ncbi:MAG: signal peptide peptidase SppA [Eubacteriales bacterium]|nr:signal peptide peptidase SppA [Eubacteriales bacterium]
MDEIKRDKEINTYNPDEILGYDNKPKNNDVSEEGKKGSTMKKALIIIAAIILCIVVLGVSCNMAANKLINLGVKTETYEDYDYDKDYIGIINIEGTISEKSSGYGEGNYNHDWTLNRIENMMKDDENKGLILFINTPGGSVFASDELYLKIKEYQKTGRPVYSAMGSMAASGGYYISAPCDKIIANRNCWTGSIGVTIGTIYDISGFLDKMGVNTVTITSGENKAMGNIVDPMTKEQKAIFQSLVDEAYDQFVGIVAEGRGMKKSEVKKIADGRIYTAKQAKKIGIIDKIGTLDDAIDDMKDKYKLRGCEVKDLSYKKETTFIDRLIGMSPLNNQSVKSQYDQLMSLVNENNKFTVTYMANVTK